MNICPVCKTRHDIIPRVDETTEPDPLPYSEQIEHCTDCKRVMLSSQVKWRDGREQAYCKVCAHVRFRTTAFYEPPLYIPGVSGGESGSGWAKEPKKR